MRKRLTAICALLLLGSALHAEQPTERHFRFTYAFTVREVPKGKPLRIWFPAAVSDAYQKVSIVSTKGDLPVKVMREREYGDSLFFAEAKESSKPEYHFEVVYDVTRVERIGYRDGQFIGPPLAVNPLVLRRFRNPDHLVPTTGRLAEIAAQQTNGITPPIQKARAIYDYVFTTMRYDKTGTGWGRGDSEWACDSKYGNCTDFHSLFSSMARSQQIPTRFAIGFPIPATKHSAEIPGYHCWADFYVNQHWVPIDISEAWKAQDKKDYYFGSHDANRVQFSVGRDITLNPPQQGTPLNYFVYPYVEVGGVESKNVRNEFSFADVNAKVAAHLINAQ